MSAFLAFPVLFLLMSAFLAFPVMVKEVPVTEMVEPRWQNSLTYLSRTPSSQARSYIEANEAMPPPRTSDATSNAQRIENFRPGAYFGVRRETVGTFAMHAILGHISGIFIDVVNLGFFTSFTVHYSCRNFLAPTRKILATRLLPVVSRHWQRVSLHV